MRDLPVAETKEETNFWKQFGVGRVELMERLLERRGEFSTAAEFIHHLNTTYELNDAEWTAMMVAVGQKMGKNQW